MLTKIDSKVIDFIDCQTTKVQKKGLLPLNTLKLIFEFSFIISITANIKIDYKNPFSYLLLLLMIVGLYSSYKNWLEAVGYWENYRKIIILNAEVLLERERSIAIRWITLFVSLVIGLPDILINGSYLWSIGMISLIIAYFLKCCRFLGPGEYECERKVDLQGLPEAGL